MRERSILRVIVSALLAGLCVFSGVCMIQDIFPESFYMDKGAVIIVIIMIVLLALVYEAGNLQGRIKWLLPAVLVVLFFACGLRGQETLRLGMLQIGRQYLNYVNDYYKTSFYLPLQGVKPEQIPIALGFLVLSVTAALYLAAVLFQKYQVLLIFPALVLSAELMVGYCPGWLGIALFATTAVLVCSHSWRVKKQEASFACLAALLFLILGVCSIFLDEPAEQISLKKEEMLAFQKNLEQRFMRLINIKGRENPGAVDNHEPEYENKEVLELWVDRNFNDPVYLRGFYGTDYYRGQWVRDKKTYQEACRNQGINMDQAAKDIANEPYDRFYEQANIVNCKITDKGTASDYQYLPYYTNMRGFSDYQLSEDYEVKRLQDDSDTISFQMIQFDYNKYLFYPDLAVLASDPLAWYNEFAESAYLKTSEEVPSAELAAEEISNTLKSQWGFDNEAFEEIPVVISSSLGMSLAIDKNYIRLQYAELVAQYLEQNYTYSCKLDQLPEDADPVEYFLSKSHKGYCVHFASAGTLILRSLGIPARYVSGYVAKFENGFVDDGGFVYSILDSNAHAWTEIYLDGVGWVPVEMTPGAMTAEDWEEIMEQLPFQDSEMQEESQTEADNLPQESSEREETESASSENNEETSDSTEESESHSEPVHDSETETASSGSNTGGQTGNENTGGGAGGLFKLWQEHKDLLGKLAVVLLSWVFLAFLFIGSYRVHLNLWNKKRQSIRADIKRKRYRRSVFCMNRQLYEQLRRTGALHTRKPSDGEYLECLIRTYPDTKQEEWEQFVQTAKKTAFSQEELTMEEAAHCRRLFDAYASVFSLGKRYVLWMMAYVVLAAALAAVIMNLK